jgi:hypothetical protein
MPPSPSNPRHERAGLCDGADGFACAVRYAGCSCRAPLTRDYAKPFVGPYAACDRPAREPALHAMQAG